MKNNIRDLNTIYAYTDINLVHQNIVKVFIHNIGKVIDVKLTSSKMKLFKRYGLNKMFNQDEDNNILDRNLVLNDINNFRKYYNGYSFSKDLDLIKRIFINNNISLKLLYRYIDSSDYLWLKDLNESCLNSGIIDDKNIYHNILTDLKTESIPKELIYDYPISLLFKFIITKNGHVKELVEPGSLNKFSKLLPKLEEQGYISKYSYKNNPDFMLFEWTGDDCDEDYFEYNGYCGNYETFFTFKKLLHYYLEGITIYNYKGKYYSYDQLKINYDINSLEHSKFINDNLLEYHKDIDDAFEDTIKYHPEVVKITCSCIDVKNPEFVKVKNYNYIMEPLANLKLIFIIKNIEFKNKKSIINPFDNITMNLSDFL